MARYGMPTRPCTKGQSKFDIELKCEEPPSCGHKGAIGLVFYAPHAFQPPTRPTPIIHHPNFVVEAY
jgi:hypothetical protein